MPIAVYAYTRMFGAGIEVCLSSTELVFHFFLPAKVCWKPSLSLNYTWLWRETFWSFLIFCSSVHCFQVEIRVPAYSLRRIAQIFISRTKLLGDGTKKRIVPPNGVPPLGTFAPQSAWQRQTKERESKEENIINLLSLGEKKASSHCRTHELAVHCNVEEILEVEQTRKPD